MRRFLGNALASFVRWVHPKAMPFALTGGQWTGTTYVDAFKRNRSPSANERIAELKGTAWTCATPPRCPVAHRGPTARMRRVNQRPVSVPMAANRRPACRVLRHPTSKSGRRYGWR
jgi:hypothetical protein